MHHRAIISLLLVVVSAPAAACKSRDTADRTRPAIMQEPVWKLVRLDSPTPTTEQVTSLSSDYIWFPVTITTTLLNLGPKSAWPLFSTEPTSSIQLEYSFTDFSSFQYEVEYSWLMEGQDCCSPYVRWAGRVFVNAWYFRLPGGRAAAGVLFTPSGLVTAWHLSFTAFSNMSKPSGHIIEECFKPPCGTPLAEIWPSSFIHQVPGLALAWLSDTEAIGLVYEASFTRTSTTDATWQGEWKPVALRRSPDSTSQLSVSRSPEEAVREGVAILRGEKAAAREVCSRWYATWESLGGWAALGPKITVAEEARVFGLDADKLCRLSNDESCNDATTIGDGWAVRHSLICNVMEGTPSQAEIEAFSNSVSIPTDRIEIALKNMRNFEADLEASIQALKSKYPGAFK